ncbi:tetratricopeptide repeat protein [Billgrantia sp. C5P2]|uniref:tetratricopeptide repeat protein n=1 Tax=Billgrantia sp. C5P2 TaxID=3436239 RepID=UPI003DA59922
MKPAKARRASITTLLLIACSPASGEPPAHYLERAGVALMEALGDPQQLENVLAIYDDGLELHPDDAELRYGRAQLLTSLGQYEEAKQDLDELHEGGLHKEGMLLRCMVHERLAGAAEDALACYAGAEAAFATASEASGQPDANHILAAHLAESPEADALLLEWPDSENSMLKEILEMEREDLIRQFLP